ncbi:fatty-acid--CoA ligase [Mycobacterium botniense]|uniref:Fatty-acid--CoA ligase n=1 Tax=Mycobacterium botniense TaxID=84962 RepID=A0A7I9XWT5_9MYCO|nr:fatty-acid--CoA ligase [Mycobacterium botniense]
MVGLGARFVVLYTSINEPGRVLVTIGIRHRTSVRELLRSPEVFEWFDLIGVDDIPAIFAGEVLQKINLVSPEAETVPPGVIIGAISAVGDVPELMTKVYDGLDRFRDAGVRKVWIYQAFDDQQEVMTLMELDSVFSAQRWIDQPDEAAEWMAGAGMGVYPGLFVGQLAHIMRAEAIR